MARIKGRGEIEAISKFTPTRAGLRRVLAVSILWACSRAFHMNGSTTNTLNAVYINRDSRVDRRLGLEEELAKAGLTAVRLPAVEVFNDTGRLSSCWDGGSRKCAGQIGCQLSHIEAIKLAMRSKWPRVAIFEDDFRWLNHTDPLLFLPVIQYLDKNFPHWDVFAISLNIIDQRSVWPPKSVQIGQVKSKFTQIKKALTTHGYILQANMYALVLEAFETCDIRADLWTAIDTCWQHLQRSHKWYALAPQLGTQASDFSDIENHVVSYGINR